MISCLHIPNLTTNSRHNHLTCVHGIVPLFRHPPGECTVLRSGSPLQPQTKPVDHQPYRTIIQEHASITRAARPPEFISDRLLKVTLELRGRAKAVTFVVAYAPTETQNTNNKHHAFWTSLDRVVEEVRKHGQLFVLMDANARTGRREKGHVGSKDSKILGAYGRDTLNDNGELLLSFANNDDLALVNTFFSTPKGGVLHTFIGRGKKRIDYILTR